MLSKTVTGLPVSQSASKHPLSNRSTNQEPGRAPPSTKDRPTARVKENLKPTEQTEQKPANQAQTSLKTKAGIQKQDGARPKKPTTVNKNYLNTAHQGIPRHCTTSAVSHPSPADGRRRTIEDRSRSSDVNNAPDHQTLRIKRLFRLKTNRSHQSA